MGDLSGAAEDYLKVIWNAAEWTGHPITVGDLAGRLGLSPSSVSESVKKLGALGLLSHKPYGAIELTDVGRSAAVGVVRKHRLIETFLVDYLGYSWDEVHEEAEILEHAVSDEFVERLARRLGDPVRDPHGDPIPRSDGTLPSFEGITLAAAPLGTAVRIGQVSDDDADLLRYLDEVGIGLDAHLVVTARHDAAGTLAVDHDDRKLVIGMRAAEAIRVVESTRVVEPGDGRRSGD